MVEDHEYAARQPNFSAINQIEEEHTYPSSAHSHDSSLASAYFNQLENQTKRRYNEKLTVRFSKGTIILPDPFGGGLHFVNNPKLWPSCFEYGDLYQYLINSPGPYTQETLKAYKSLESYRYFLKGFVQAILYSSVSDDSPVCVLRGRFVHSQSVSKPPVNAWVTVNKSTGSVVAAHCMCMAGLGEACSHIAAILFKLEAANRLGYTTQACTEKACTWNQDFLKGKELAPCAIQDLHFVKPHYDRYGQIRSTKTNVEEVTSKATLESLDLSTLRQINPDACVFSLLPKEDDEDTDTASENENNVNIKWQPTLPKPFCNLNKDEITENLSITSEQAHLIASCTTGQKKSNLWPLYCFGRVTASVLGSVVKFMDGSSKRDVSSLCAKMLGKNSFCPTKAMKWGIDHESVALDSLKGHLEFEGHQDIKMWSVGLYIDPDSPFLGASPDSLVSCACCGVQTVEVKCPNNKNSNNLDPNTFHGAKAVGCLKVLGDERKYKISLKERHDYFFQVLCQIGVLNKLMTVSSGLFVVWTPRGLFVQKINHKEDLWKQVKEYSMLFFEQYLQPAIIREINKPEL